MNVNDGRRREEWLLKDAAILCERYGAGRPEPFNVFTALRSESDEVNLHSRFLVALLDHRKPGEKNRANLDDFIKQFAPEPLRDFAPDGAKVERERHHIDILITNDYGQALAIENKIYAGDQDQQLTRYHKELVDQGYKDIHLLYLTIDGRGPSENSRGKLGEKDYTSISYNDILPWLERCRKRTYDEPELRDSIVQYSRLIKRMTGNDRGSKLMKELKELCLQDDNLLVAHHLAEALVHAKASLMHDMWEKIKSVLEKHSFTDLVKGEESSNISEDTIRNAIVGKRGRSFGLYYRFGQETAVLGVEAAAGYGFVVGVYCKKDANEEKYDAIRERLESKLGEKGKPDNSWPWWCVLRRDGTGLQPDDIKILADENKRNELVESIAQSAVEKLNAIREVLDPANS